ncbi:hypothetical protein GCM10023219_06230 [Stakelama sediminis]|uniref:Pimeloyl-ACP methyl ester carboxylesterase n=1 Tax=Stakelama sediminis TaxID=463200 RepID=A0A840YUL4_9SPHN|nr:lysophospholipase [Stakelama sediminis]MBB5717341.1 pimeloyl-ACP methyl ester carboxylesterase [Stakelama sediminis]
MRCNRKTLLLALPLALAGCMATKVMPPPETPLYAQRTGDTAASRVKTLVVILPGDGTADKRTDPADFAAQVTKTIPDSAVLTILRPGYADQEGNRSPGERGDGSGDNYTRDRINLVGETIAAWRTRMPHAKVIVVGVNGGAAIAADLAGIESGIIDGMVLLSCPCTLPEWRRHMAKQTGAPEWSAPVESLDPLQTAGGVAADMRAAILVGADDTIAPRRFSGPYAEALALRGIATDYHILPNRGHRLLNDPETLKATERLAAALTGKR